MFTLLVALLTLERVVKSLATDKHPFAHLTTYSNTLTLIALLSRERLNAHTVCGISAVNFSMMTAFWSIYATSGRRSLYGDYEPSLYEICVDHLLIPLSGVVLCVTGRRACFLKPVGSAAAFLLTWVLLAASKPDAPPYPVITGEDGRLHVSHFSALIVVFFIVAILYLSIAQKARTIKNSHGQR